MAEECEDECGCGEPTLSVSRARYTSFVVTGPTIFGKANALAPVRTEKVCCDFFFGICLLTVSVFWIQQFFEGFSVQQSLQFFRRHDLGNCSSYVGICLKPCPKGVCLKSGMSQVMAVQWGKATFQSPGFGCVEIKGTPNVKVRKVAVASSIFTHENDQF